ncbi:MAG TPA: septum formation initiator family protein [Terriglobales bacterium]|nr:septum formation initiator family protein [Terriglobales bacterium]
MDIRVNLPKLRILPAPEERLRTLTNGADQAEALAEKARVKAEPYLQTVYAVRRRLATGAVAVLTVWLFVHVMFGANGMAVYRAKKAEYQKLQKDIDGLQKENDEYTEQVNELKTDPKRIEKEAREQFHYARPGEVIYVAPAPPPPAQPATRTAQR